jgi:hypothetical protein
MNKAELAAWLRGEIEQWEPLLSHIATARLGG